MHRLNHLVVSINWKQLRLAVMVLTIALFAISAAAPNATIGIGK